VWDLRVRVESFRSSSERKNHRRRTHYSPKPRERVERIIFRVGSWTSGPRTIFRKTTSAYKKQHRDVRRLFFNKQNTNRASVHHVGAFWADAVRRACSVCVYIYTYRTSPPPTLRVRPTSLKRKPESYYKNNNNNADSKFLLLFTCTTSSATI